ncbi:hypothetical protein [Nocardioides antri]|uniref:Uncharacterized protein n=1 Tax=Nocardioides antri TaxID=2607659 RepID=A0A5B1M0K1_9ACTN|nr:hypothetical protein [Nocardioides antri]KAA1426452.1 hypothetical protein F0U47_13695 [Nocardioides antri]
MALVQDYADRLGYANQTIAHIERAQRQERRLQRAYRKMMAKHEAIDLSETDSRFAPAEWVEPLTKFEDELYFLVVELRQVLRGHDLMEHMGFPMPTFRQADLIESWRDIEEHWNDPPKGKEIWAFKKWRSVSEEEEPGLSLSGAGKLREASGLRMKWVRKDLQVLHEAVGEVSEREWDHCYLTPDEAAGMLGVTTQELEAMDPPPVHLDFEGDLGVRYWREGVEARREGWIYPPRWIEEGVIPGLSADSPQDNRF